MTRVGSLTAGILGRIVMLGMCTVLLAACATRAPDNTDNAVAGDLIAGEATVEFVELEGGCWTLDLAGERLLPLVLPEAFREDGLRVRVSLRLIEAATICMLGRTVEIESIKRVE